MRELRISLDVYFPMKENETRVEAIERSDKFLHNAFDRYDIPFYTYKRTIIKATK